MVYFSQISDIVPPGSPLSLAIKGAEDHLPSGAASILVPGELCPQFECWVSDIEPFDVVDTGWSVDGLLLNFATTLDAARFRVMCPVDTINIGNSEC